MVGLELCRGGFRAGFIDYPVERIVKKKNAKGKKQNDYRRSGTHNGKGGRSLTTVEKPPCLYKGCEARSRSKHCTSACPTLLKKLKGSSSKNDEDKVQARSTALAERKIKKVKFKLKQEAKKKEILRNVSLTGKSNAASKAAVVPMSSDDEMDADSD